MSRYSIHPFVLGCLLLAAGCGGVRGPGGAGRARPDRAAEARRATAALQAAEELYEQKAYPAAAARADSLYRAWKDVRYLNAVANRALWLKGRSWEAAGDLAVARQALQELVHRLRTGSVRTEAVDRLAAILHVTGEDSEAVELLLSNPEAIGDEEVALIRSAAIRVAPDELERLALQYPVERPGGSVVHSELARSLALNGQADSARRVATRVLRVAPAGSEEAELAQAVVSAGRGGPMNAAVGAVLPLSGRFAPVGNLLREGMDLALEEWNRDHAGSPEVELLVRDNASNPERSVGLVTELEAAGVLSVIGPVRSESFTAAALGRRNPRLLLVSPTATDILQPAAGAYTLWSRQRRYYDVARDVAKWIVTRLGLRRAAILYPRTRGGGWAADGFRAGIEEEKGELVAAEPYAPEATTFAEPIQAVAEVKPDAVFVAAESAPAVLQIAPQLFYFGVDRSVVAGGASWAEPAVLRQLDAFAANYRIVGTFLDRTAEGTPFAHFRDTYEREYGKLLHDNMLPPLGYDAMKLVLAGIQKARFPFPGAVSRAVGELGEVAGVTGILRPDPKTSTVARRTVIEMLRNQHLQPADPETVLAWLADARARADSIAEARADSIAQAKLQRPSSR